MHVLKGIEPQSHVLPVDDVLTHRLCEHCACEPVEDAEQDGLFVHNARDQRTDYASGRRKPH